MLPLTNVEGETSSYSTLRIHSVRGGNDAEDTLSSQDEVEDLLSEKDKEFADLPLVLEEDQNVS